MRTVLLVILAVLSWRAWADVSDPKRFVGSYVLESGGCGFAPSVALVELDQAYELQWLRADGGIWSTREYRQLNGASWYEADLGYDGTVRGRSRYACSSDTTCWLWNERQECHRLVLPVCGRWASNEADWVDLTPTRLTLRTQNGQECAYQRSGP